MENQKGLTPLVIIIVIIGILAAGYFIFYRKSCEPFSGATAGIDSHYIRSNDKLYFCQTLFEKFIGVASAEKELRNKIASACSGGKIISTECAQLLNEFRTKYPGKMDTGENISNLVLGPAADWKTYRNEEYGFEMRYPVKYKVVEDTYGWPNALVLLIETGGAQSYASAIELWDSENEFLNERKYVANFYKKIGNMGDKSLTFSSWREDEEEFNQIFSTFKFISQ